jgi:hypothetical protein
VSVFGFQFESDFERVTGVFPWLFTYRISVVVAPGVRVPQFIEDNAVLHVWSLYIPIDAWGVTVGVGVGEGVDVGVGVDIGEGVGFAVGVGVGVGVDNIRGIKVA